MSGNNEIDKYPTISGLFGLLNRWRHLPNYQLERRADVFFALFLPEVLGNHVGTDINPILVPEFPIKNKSDYNSRKVDYLALEKTDNNHPVERAFLVELKTDMASRREDQDGHFNYAIGMGLQKLVIGVLEICAVTNQKHKYVHLLKLLSDIHLIEYHSGLFPVKQGYSKILERIKDKVERRKVWPSLEVVYVQPELTDVIDFKLFAAAIEERGEIGRLFAGYLRKWASEKQAPGSVDPRAWHR